MPASSVAGWVSACGLPWGEPATTCRVTACAAVVSGGQSSSWMAQPSSRLLTDAYTQQFTIKPTCTVILSREASEGSNQRERLQITARPLRHSHPFAHPPDGPADAGIPCRRYPLVRLSHLLFSCFVIPVNSDPICGIAFALFLDISSLFIHHVINRWVDNRRVDMKRGDRNAYWQSL